MLKYLPHLLESEGVIFTEDPSDPGGATNAGVTIGTFRRFFGADKSKDDLRRMTLTQWAQVMQSYWDGVQAEKITRQEVAEMLVDWYINAGPAAIKSAQRALGCVADGIVGSKTLAALNDVGAFVKLTRARLAYYDALVERNPNMRKYINGWRNRTLRIKPRN